MNRIPTPHIGQRTTDKVPTALCLLLCLLWGGVGQAWADDKPKEDTRPYLCEFGIQAGCGYYAGDATTHIFNNPREAYGAHFRYKFDQRWALQVKGLAHRITGVDYDDNLQPIIDEQTGKKKMWSTQMINIDVVAEFNFFRFGERQYDRRVKPITPYIFLGAGVSVYGSGLYPVNWDWKYFGGNDPEKVDETQVPCLLEKKKAVPVAFYFPLGFGMKWKFSDRLGLNIAWQHNIYMADNLEGRSSLNNSHDMNGSNILNFDITSQITLGIVFEFAKETKVCLHCQD